MKLPNLSLVAVFAVLLAPAIAAWILALWTIWQDASFSGAKLALSFSLPPMLWIGQAVDGNWTPALVAILGTTAAGILLVVFYKFWSRHGRNAG